MEEQNSTTPSTQQGCGKYLKGCAVVAGLVCLALIGLLVYLSRMPNVHSMVQCEQNMLTLHKALKRYHDANNAYPVSLADLKDEYLTDPSVIVCPEDKSGDPRTSYTYNRPEADAKGDFVVIECGRHVLLKDTPPAVLRIGLDGKRRAVPSAVSEPQSGN